MFLFKIVKKTYGKVLIFSDACSMDIISFVDKSTIKYFSEIFNCFLINGLICILKKINQFLNFQLQAMKYFINYTKQLEYIILGRYV